MEETNNKPLKREYDQLEKETEEANNDTNGIEYSDVHAGPENSEQVVSKGSKPLDQLKACPEYGLRKEYQDTVPKRKYACCFAYLGTNYQGLQLNPGCRSVEAEIERALFLTGCFPESNYGCFQKLHWTRAARTDRGVHAIGQCCSLRMNFPIESTERAAAINRVNEILPSDIRLIAITKVAKSFSSHTTCAGRSYSYLLPTYLFTDHTILDDLFVRALEIQGPIVDCARVGGYVEPGSDKYLGLIALKSVRDQISSYRCTKEKLALFRKCMKFYEGTKSYHNFTTGKDSNDDSCKRYITMCKCTDPFLDSPENAKKAFGDTASRIGIPCDTTNSDESSISGMDSSNVVPPTEYVVVSLQGQSFVLNQIRKMIALAVDVTRGYVPFTMMAQALSPLKKVEVPLAPGLGLYLKQLHFDHYNARQSQEKDRRAQSSCGRSHKSIKRAKQEERVKAIETIKAAALLAVQRALAVTFDSSLIEDEGDANKTFPSTKIRNGDENETIDNVAPTAPLFASSSQPTHSIDPAAPTAITQYVTEVNAAYDDEADAEDNIGDQILWWSDKDTVEKMKYFQDHVLWPHIFEQARVFWANLFWCIKEFQS